MSDINPRIDMAFKKLFGVEENKDLLISLLNSIVSKEDQIAEVIILNPYNAKNFKADKLSVLDIKAKSEEGKLFNIEIQVADEDDYEKRALYYWSKLYSNQLEVAERYENLPKTIGIHILNFVSISGAKSYHNVFQIREKESGLHYFQDLELHTIELAKFTENGKKEFVELVKKVKSSLDRWTTFLTNHNLLDKNNLPENLKDPNLEKALEVMEVMNLNKEEREAYEDRVKWFRFEASALAKQRREGKAEGKIEVARNLLSLKVDIETIQKSTGLSKEAIESLI